MVVESLSLEVFKTHLHSFLWNRSWETYFCRRLDSMIFIGPFQALWFSWSMILWYLWSFFWYHMLFEKKESTVGDLARRMFHYLIWILQFLRPLMPSLFCYFEFWEGIDKCTVSVNFLFHIPCSFAPIVIFSPVPDLSTQSVSCLRALIGLSCCEWLHQRPPIYTIFPGTQMKIKPGSSVHPIHSQQL